MTPAQTPRVMRIIVRSMLGLMVGAFLLVLLDNAFLLNPGSEGPGGDTISVLISALWFLGWAVGAVAIGALAGWIAGRLEILIAVGSVAISTSLLWFLPPLFRFLNSYLGEPLDMYLGGTRSLGSMAILINAPVLLFSVTGGVLVFFARRTDLR